MLRTRRQHTEKLSLPSRLVVTVGLILLLLLVGTSVGLAQEDPVTSRQVRALEPDELGISRPAGLAFSPAANVFYVVEGRVSGESPALSSDITVLSASPLEDGAGTVRLPTAVPDPLNMTFDGKGSRLLILQPATGELADIAARPDGELISMSLTHHSLYRFGLRSPRGMAVDPASGVLYILDGIRPQIVRIEPDLDGAFDGARITRYPVEVNLSGLRGLALNPANDHLYSLSPSQQTLYEFTQAGRMVSSHDLSTLGLRDPQGLVFAPTGDQTDDPSLNSLYIADSGLDAGRDQLTIAQTGGRVVELAFDAMEPSAITADVSAILVNTIDTSAFHPPSPDSAGLFYSESSGTLLMTDSEVDEMSAYFTGDNVFEMTLDGRLLRTGTTLPYTYEPSGLAYNPSNDHIFISDDGTKRIFEIAGPGADGEYLTADDDYSFFYTEPFGCPDAEGIAFDTLEGVLYLASGLNAELYRIDPGGNGVFDGVENGGDDVVTNWDVESLGMTDPGGLTFDEATGYLYMVGAPRNSMAELLVVGDALSLVRMIDMSAANPRVPAGVTIAPSTLDPRETSIYVSARGVDNNTDPLENDGKVYELYVPAHSADVVLDKSMEPTVALAGEVVTFTLSFYNAGGNTARGVDITDIIPAELTVQNVISSGVDIENSGAPTPYVWWVQDLSTDAQGFITITAEVASTLACFDTFENTATIATTSEDTRPDNDSSSVIVAVGAGVSVVPDSNSSPADQGEAVVYPLNVTNDGTCPDTFDVSVSGTGWTVDVPDPVALGGGETVSVDITVHVPSDAPCGPESAVITFTSQNAASVSASSELVTTVNEVYGVEVGPPGYTLSGFPGDELAYTLWMTNTGNCIEAFDIATSEPSWVSDIPSAVVPVYPGLVQQVPVSVTVPLDALAIDEDITTVTFTSQSDGTISGTSLLTTTVGVVYGVEVAPSTASDAGDPGTSVPYTLTVTNTGNVSDTFSIDVISDAWSASYPPTVTLDAHVSADVPVTVTVDPGAMCNEQDTATVTFTSIDGVTSDSSVLTTSANTVHDVEVILPAPSTIYADPGSEVVYTLRVYNWGNCTDTFDVSVTGTEWQVTPESDPIEVVPSILTSMDITVTVPSDAPCGPEVATVTLTSQFDSMASDSAILTTSVNPISALEIGPTSPGLSGDPGSEVGYTLWLTNTGNCADTFNVSVLEDQWVATADPTEVPLEPDVAASVTVSVTVAAEAHCVDSDITTVTFTSEDETASDSAILTTSVNPVSALQIGPTSPGLSGDPGSEVEYTLWVTNTGNCADTFNVSVLEDQWAATAGPTDVPLEPDAAASVEVTVTIPSDAQCGVDVTTVTFTSEDETASDSATLTTSATAVRGVTVGASITELSGDPGGDPVVYTLSVTNDGNCVDTFSFAASGNGWETSAPAVGPLQPGASADVDVTVTVDPGALCNEHDTATVTFTSIDTVTSDSSVLTTTANQVYGVMVEALDPTLSGDPGGDPVVYVLSVTNTGNCSDTFIRSFTGNAWFMTSVPSVALDPDEFVDVDVTAAVPACTAGGVRDIATVTFASQAPGTASDSAVLTTTANHVAPVAGDDEYSTTEDLELVVTAGGSPAGLLENDSDANCDPLEVSQYTQPSDGTVVVDAAGSFTYIPDPNFHGIDSFTYDASDGGLAGTATVTITVVSAGDDPVVDAGPDLPEAGDPPIEEGDTVSFSGTFVDPARTLADGESIHWDFGDGQSATGTLTPDHIYLDDDEYTVTLTITDTQGDVGQDSMLVTVINVAPEVNAGPDQVVSPGDVVSFSGIYTDTVADTHTIEWDLGDDTIVYDNLVFDHVYEAPGVYTVTLTVTDDDGGVGTDVAIIRVMHRVYLPLIFRSF